MASSAASGRLQTVFMPLPTSPSKNDLYEISRKLLELETSKIYHDVALESLYIPTGNDAIIYFRSSANCINVFILGHVRVAISFLDNGLIDFEKVYSFERVIQVVHFLFFVTRQIFLLPDPESGVQIDLPGYHCLRIA